LKEIAELPPPVPAEVIAELELRRITCPIAEPFHSAGGGGTRDFVATLLAQSVGYPNGGTISTYRRSVAARHPAQSNYCKYFTFKFFSSRKHLKPCDLDSHTTILNPANISPSCEMRQNLIRRINWGVSPHPGATGATRRRCINCALWTTRHDPTNFEHD
jgi:hypothetical protein